MEPARAHVRYADTLPRPAWLRCCRQAYTMRMRMAVCGLNNPTSETNLAHCFIMIGARMQ